MASSVNNGKGTDTAFGETPASPLPISSIVYTLAGGTWQRCLEASKTTLDGFDATTVGIRGIEEEEIAEYFLFREKRDDDEAETNDGKNGCGTSWDLRVSIVAISDGSRDPAYHFVVNCSTVCSHLKARTNVCLKTALLERKVQQDSH